MNVRVGDIHEWKNRNGYSWQVLVVGVRHNPDGQAEVNTGEGWFQIQDKVAWPDGGKLVCRIQVDGADHIRNSHIRKSGVEL